MPSPCLPPQCLGEVVRFRFPHADMVQQIYVLSYEDCELRWVFIGGRVNVRREILGVASIMGGRWVCCILGVCLVYIRE